MKYQVTLFCKSGKYKPVSALVECAKAVTKEDVKAIQARGIEKICVNRLWNKKDLANYGYTSVKVRVYDKEKIEQEAKERYEQIKEAKYASGEWKRPKEKS